jgi:hypothetical protein
MLKSVGLDKAQLRKVEIERCPRPKLHILSNHN